MRGSYPVDRTGIAHGWIHVEVRVDVGLAVRVLGRMWWWWYLMNVGLNDGVDRSGRRVMCLHCLFTEMRR